MTVGELIDYLSTQPSDRLVIIAKDASGNGYSPLAGVEDAYYLAESTWSGELVSDEDLEDGEEIDPDAVPVVVLGPVN